MNLKSISKTTYKVSLSILFGISVMSNYAYSENNKEKTKYIGSENKIMSEVSKLQVLVESYDSDYPERFPVSVNNLRPFDEDVISGSNGIVIKAKSIIDNSIDYSEYAKLTDKSKFKNKVIYKPLKISSDKSFASGYQIYSTDKNGNFAKVKNEVFYAENNTSIKTTMNTDNFSNPDGFIEPAYHYKYFVLRTDGHDTEAKTNKLIDKCLAELKKGNKTQQIYFNLSILYLKNKDKNNQNKISDDFLRDFPNSAEAYHVKSMLNRNEKSIPLLEKAVSLDVKNPNYRADLAYLYMKYKSYDKALAQLEKIKSEMPFAVSDIDERIKEVNQLIKK